jgi:hypothetical protein
MYHSRDVLEQPLVRTIIEEHNTLTLNFLTIHIPKFAPTLGNQRTDASPFDCIYNHGSQSTWVIDHYATEPDIDRRRCAIQEGSQLLIRLKSWAFPKKEPTNVFRKKRRKNQLEGGGRYSRRELSHQCNLANRMALVPTTVTSST